MVVCLAIRSDIFQRTSWALAVGVMAAYTVLFRYIVSTYVVGIALVWLLIVILAGRSFWEIREPTPVNSSVDWSWRLSRFALWFGPCCRTLDELL